MERLQDALEQNQAKMRERLFLTDKLWHQIMGTIRENPAELYTSSNVCKNEKIWTFLAASGYALCGIEGVEKLTNILTGSCLPQPDDARIWMEVLSYPPRIQEGNTQIDLAVGTISIREGTEGGIELGKNSPSWICFSEMKWFSDLSISTTHDLRRNQLARVIENALYFNDRAGNSDQRGARYSDDVYVSLVTPKAFRDTEVKSRLYQYKYEEYKAADLNGLIKDLNASALKLRNPSASLGQQLERLACIRWVTYDDIFAQMPKSEISPELLSFWEERGGYQGRET